MGQYHCTFNKTKKEFIHPHHIDCGLKLWEQIGFPASTSSALFMLLVNSNDRGGGDFPAHPDIGRWAGDSIVVQVDYAEEGDPGFITEEELLDYTNISNDVLDMLTYTLKHF